MLARFPISSPTSAQSQRLGGPTADLAESSRGEPGCTTCSPVMVRKVRQPVGSTRRKSPPQKSSTCLLLVVVVSGNSFQGLEDEVDSRVELVLQLLQLQDLGFWCLAIKGQHLHQCVDHIVSTADQSLKALKMFSGVKGVNVWS